MKPAACRRFGECRRCADSLDDEATAYIFKDVSDDESQEACYEMVEDENELQAVFKVFEQMLDDVDLEM